MEQVCEGLDHSRNEEVWGGGALWYAHRVDLHGGLLGLVLDTNNEIDNMNLNVSGQEEAVNGRRRSEERKGWVRIEGGKEVVEYVSCTYLTLLHIRRPLVPFLSSIKQKL